MRAHNHDGTEQGIIDRMNEEDMRVAHEYSCGKKRPMGGAFDFLKKSRRVPEDSLKDTAGDSLEERAAVINFPKNPLKDDAAGSGYAECPEKPAFQRKKLGRPRTRKGPLMAALLMLVTAYAGISLYARIGNKLSDMDKRYTNLITDMQNSNMNMMAGMEKILYSELGNFAELLKDGYKKNDERITSLQNSYDGKISHIEDSLYKEFERKTSDIRDSIAGLRNEAGNDRETLESNITLINNNINRLESEMRQYSSQSDKIKELESEVNLLKEKLDDVNLQNPSTPVIYIRPYIDTTTRIRQGPINSHLIDINSFEDTSVYTTALARASENLKSNFNIRLEWSDFSSYTTASDDTTNSAFGGFNNFVNSQDSSGSQKGIYAFFFRGEDNDDAAGIGRWEGNRIAIDYSRDVKWVTHVILHELGHNFGLTYNNPKDTHHLGDRGYIMSQGSGLSFEWDPDSKRQIIEKLNSGELNRIITYF